MSHKNKLSLTAQIKQILDDKLAIGESKHAAKGNGTYRNYIYSYKTYRSYMEHCIRFAKYCHSEYGCRTIASCRIYVDKWLTIESQTKSPWTVKLEAAALAKLYNCTTSAFIKTPPRKFENITRSRGKKMMDRHFSEAKNDVLVRFCRSTGLRRSELSSLRGNQLIHRSGQYFIGVRGKGGRYREAPIIGDVRLVVEIMQKAGQEKVFKKIHSAADIHSYRSEYATQIYNSYARSYSICKSTPFYNKEHSNGPGKPKGGWDKNSIYYMRGSSKEKWLDKKAMQIVSHALGHNRISVVTYYIR